VGQSSAQVSYFAGFGFALFPTPIPHRVPYNGTYTKARRDGSRFVRAVAVAMGAVVECAEE
jgi:hypothetical protein